MIKNGLVLDRRALLTAAGAAGIVASQRLAAAAPGKVAPGTETTLPIEDATNVALTLSPDGQRIAFDLLGILWVIPVGGGPARRLTGDFDDLGQPDWSPDGSRGSRSSRIAPATFTSGRWRPTAATCASTPMAASAPAPGGGDDREPRWSPDGKHIAFSSDREGGRYAIYLLDVASGDVSAFSQGSSNDSEPCWSPDGRTIAYVADAKRLMVAGLDGSPAREVTAVPVATDRLLASAILAPSFAPDGTLAYTRQTPGAVTLVHGTRDIVSGEDLYPFRPAWLGDGGFLYGAGGKLRRAGSTADSKGQVVPFVAQVPVTTPHYTKKRRDFTSTTQRPVVGIAAPQLSPDGRQIAFCALNDIYLMTIGEAPRRLTQDGYHKCDPAWSPDGGGLVYACDRGGTLDLWVRDMSTGAEVQLTNLPDQAAAWTAWSPDGKQIAFLDQTGALHIVDIAGGAVRKLYDALWEPGRPSFGPDGRTIAYAAFKPRSARYREGLSEILSVDVATGRGTYRPIAPGKSLATRGHDGPAWSPDGTMMAYIFASTLWVAPVDAEGAFTGPPRQLTREVSDAPSWSGDAKTLLYLSNGRLRIVPAAGGTPTTVPLRLQWVNAVPQQRLVVRAGRMWDPASDAYRDNVDVVIDGNRIAAITPATTGAPSDANARLLDGSGLTLMPGLIDMHTHRQMAGYGYGDRMGRLWLAMGITATRSPGCPAYHMVEDREAIDAGHRVAARHYATGEAIDGSRIFYNFMRPLTEPGQLDLEMERAQALSYDMVKTYVRLRHDIQKQVVDRAHPLGMHLSSHYHYPALHSGMDCMEHLGATNRYGYSRTITALGGGYGDVNRLFAGAKAGRTPTMFVASVLLADDPGLAEDKRIRTLFPPWEYAKLTERVAGVQAARPTLTAALERWVDQIRQTLADGWHVINGTDAPIDLVAISLHLSLRGMTRFGVTPLEALRCTTLHSGAFLGEPIGRVAPGYLADLILVGGDPLTKVEAVADVRHVIANGAAHTPETLMAPFAGTRVSSVGNRELPPRHGRDGYFWQTAAYVEESRGACCAGHNLLLPPHAHA